MKYVLMFPVFLISGLFSSAAQNMQWQQKANFILGTRSGAVGFSINAKGYVSCGMDYIGSSFVYYADLWEYDPSLNSWSQKASLPAPARISASAFVIDSVGYVGLGYSTTSGTLADLWAYDPAVNGWMQKATFPGVSRYTATSFALNGFGYFGSGLDFGSGLFSDFYKYYPANNAWYTVANLPSARQSSGAFSLNGYGYVVGGAAGSTNFFEVYRYNDTTNSWQLKSSYPGGGSYALSIIVINGYAYIGTGSDQSVTFSDFHKFDPINNAWLTVPTFPPGGRLSSTCFTIGNKGYVGLGSSLVFPSISYQDDLWELAETVTMNEITNQSVHVNVYPNPTYGTLTIHSDINKEILFSLRNSIGKEVINMQINSGVGVYKINTSNLENGIYFWSAYTYNNLHLTGKIIVLN